MSGPERTTDNAGCARCRQWIGEYNYTTHRHGELVDGGDCASSFIEVDSYFSARLLRCPICSTAWLLGYHEDFSNTKIEDEWGERIFVIHPITAEQFEAIKAAAGTASLDLDSFGR